MQGINAPAKAGDPMERMQERLDRAGSSRERDEIYADVAVALAHQGNARARDLADKIEDSMRRLKVQQYVDLQLVQEAIKHPTRVGLHSGLEDLYGLRASAHCRAIS